MGSLTSNMEDICELIFSETLQLSNVSLNFFEWALLSSFLKLIILKVQFRLFKDGAYYCYCAYVLRISRYSDFLSVMLTNTGIFLRGLKLPGESRS